MVTATGVKKGTIPTTFIESLLARADLVQVINQRVPLKKAGGSYKACCPFHDEKTPSFHVSPQKQSYHCFGCGAHGDAINFLKEYDGLSFVEAVETLAAMYGMEVPREKLSPQQAKQQEKAKTLYDVMFSVTKFYRQQLGYSEVAKNYLKQRGLSAEIAKTFVIGYAPDGWDGLVKALKADQALTQQLIESGMLIQKEAGGTYDRFRDRIMFPIRDGRGRVIAFGGRILGDGQPKYLNSPETPIFHKSQTLYGLYEMRQARISPERILVVEGYMDVVALAQFEVRNAVATLGTAITEQHLIILFKEVNEVVFCFDGDEAGKKAAWKALELALPVVDGTKLVKFLFLPQGEDPDSMVRKEGKAGFESRVKQSLLLSEFLFKKLTGELGAPLTSPEGQQQLISLVQPYIQKAPPANQDVLVNGLADLVPIPVWRLGQIMGVRVASSKKVPSRPFAPEKSVLPKVTSGVLKLMRILCLRPVWAQIFDEALLEGLSRCENEQYVFLARFLLVLQQNNFLIESIENWVQENGYQSLWQQLQGGDLVNDTQFLMSEFDFLVAKVVKDLEQQRLKRAALGSGDLSELQALVVAQKKTK